MELEEAAIAYRRRDEGSSDLGIHRFCVPVSDATVKPVFDTAFHWSHMTGNHLPGKTRDERAPEPDARTLEYNDIISLADVLEYELKPALESGAVLP